MSGKTAISVRYALLAVLHIRSWKHMQYTHTTHVHRHKPIRTRIRLALHSLWCGWNNRLVDGLKEPHYFDKCFIHVHLRTCILFAGGIAAGIISDRLKARAIICVVMLVLAIPSVSVWLLILMSIIGIYTCTYLATKCFKRCLVSYGMGGSDYRLH